MVLRRGRAAAGGLVWVLGAVGRGYRNNVPKRSHFRIAALAAAAGDNQAERDGDEDGRPLLVVATGTGRRRPVPGVLPVAAVEILDGHAPDFLGDDEARV